MFPFWSLPAELRELIYEFVLHPTPPKDIIFNLRHWNGAAPGLLLVNKQIYNEAIHIYQRQAPRHVRVIFAPIFRRGLREIDFSTTKIDLSIPPLDAVTASQIREVVVHQPDATEHMVNDRNFEWLSHILDNKDGFTSWLRKTPNVECIHLILDRHTSHYASMALNMPRYLIMRRSILWYRYESRVQQLSQSILNLLEASKVGRLFMYLDHGERRETFVIAPANLQINPRKFSMSHWSWSRSDAHELLEEFQVGQINYIGTDSYCIYSAGYRCRFETAKVKCGCNAARLACGNLYLSYPPL